MNQWRKSFWTYSFINFLFQAQRLFKYSWVIDLIKPILNIFKVIFAVDQMLVKEVHHFLDYDLIENEWWLIQYSIANGFSHGVGFWQGKVGNVNIGEIEDGSTVKAFVFEFVHICAIWACEVKEARMFKEADVLEVQT